MSRGARVVLILGACAIGACLLGAWWLSRRPAPHETRAEDVAHPDAPARDEAPAPRAPVEAASAAASAEREKPAAPHADDAADAPAHAHPITPQHGALRAERQLVAALNDALDLRDASSLRTLITRYDALSPDDPQRLAEGYARLADCIEAQDPARKHSARANAQHYYDDARASPLLRHVRRVCFEN